MVKTQIIIREYEDTSKGGFARTRFKVEYSNGEVKWMSAFRKTDKEKQVVADCKEYEGKLISVEIVEKANNQNADKPFFNITDFYGKVAPGLENKETTKEEIEVVKIEDKKPLLKTPIKYPSTDMAFKSMYVSYAKDVFIALGQLMRDAPEEGKKRSTPSESMDIAIQLVKQAREAFS